MTRRHRKDKKQKTDDRTKKTEYRILESRCEIRFTVHQLRTAAAAPAKRVDQSPDKTNRKIKPRTIEKTCQRTVDFPIHAIIVRKSPVVMAKTAMANMMKYRPL